MSQTADAEFQKALENLYAALGEPPDAVIDGNVPYSALARWKELRELQLAVEARLKQVEVEASHEPDAPLRESAGL
jgi:hypothetical protein